jgi:Predicted membrane protein
VRALPRRVEFEDIIGWSLRVGVLISAALIIFGLALIFYSHGAGTFKLGELIAARSPVNTSMLPVSYVNASNLANLNGLTFILLGLIVLMATPVLRVAIGIAQFAHERNWLYTFITLVVFMNLMLAIFVIPALVAK